MVVQRKGGKEGGLKERLEGKIKGTTERRVHGSDLKTEEREEVTWNGGTTKATVLKFSC